MKALITGITGQDGSYLAELLLKKGYEVHGILRDVQKRGRLEAKDVILHTGDLVDELSIRMVIEKVIPDELYNLGGVSNVGESFKNPEYTENTVALGPVRILETIRHIGLKTKFFQASSAEIFGDTVITPQNEETPMSPRNPYGVAKAHAHTEVIRYRTEYGIFACNGILFPHVSPRSGDTTVVRTITTGVADILAGKNHVIRLKNLNAKRDWGYAPEYVEAMAGMLDQDQPDDFILATGEVHTVRNIVKEAFHLSGIENWEKYIILDERFDRPEEKSVLRGDATKAKEKLGWHPIITWSELVRNMLAADCARVGVKLPL